MIAAREIAILSYVGYFKVVPAVNPNKKIHLYIYIHIYMCQMSESNIWQSFSLQLKAAFMSRELAQNTSYSIQYSSLPESCTFY